MVSCTLEIMSKQINEKSFNDRLKEKYTAENDRALEALRNEMAEKQKEHEKRLEDKTRGV